MSPSCATRLSCRDCSSVPNPRSTLKTRALTPMQRVKAKYPKAYCRDGLMSGDWYVYRGQYGSSPIASGITGKQAWANAAKALGL